LLFVIKRNSAILLCTCSPCTVLFYSFFLLTDSS
jgi:hypothetical protein